MSTLFRKSDDPILSPAIEKEAYMKKMLLGLIFLSCTSVSAYAGPQERGMLTGAAVGATAGALIGSRSNDTAEGAVIGAMFGAIAGALLSDAEADPVYYGHQYREEPEYGSRHAYEEHREHEMLERYHRRHVRMYRNGYGYHRSDTYGHYRHHGGRFDEHAMHEAYERHEYREHHGHHQHGTRHQYYAWAD